MKIKLEIGRETARWVDAVAKANGITIEELLLQAAECLADGAGRRTGSWEGEIGERLLNSSGWPKREFPADW